MFSFPFGAAPFNVERMARTTFRVTFCTYGLSGSGLSLISMLVEAVASRLLVIIGVMRLSIVSVSFSGCFVALIMGIFWFFSASGISPTKARIGLKNRVASSISFLFLTVTIFGTVGS